MSFLEALVAIISSHAVTIRKSNAVVTDPKIAPGRWAEIKEAVREGGRNNGKRDYKAVKVDILCEVFFVPQMCLLACHTTICSCRTKEREIQQLVQECLMQT
jgi:hypothetical protein